MELTVRPLQQKRKYTGKVDQEQSKCAKTVICWERSDNKQIKDLASIL